MNEIPFGQQYTRSRSLVTLSPNGLPSNLSERLCVALGSRLKPDAALELYRKFLTDYSGIDPTILAFCENHGLQLARSHNEFWPQALALVKRKYELGIINDDYYWMHQGDSLTDTLPPDVAAQIASQPQAYPRFLVYLAEGRCQLEVETKLPSIADVAQIEGWFAPAVDRR